jgi:DNA-3-methyladenine glycosylase I
MTKAVHKSEGCTWPGLSDPLYTRYHDEEWGVPRAGEHELFEKLVLEGFQAGLSWLTILRKRENFQKAFRGFDPEKIARFTDKDIERLMADAGIVRNRAKIEAAIDNAKAYLELRKTMTLAAFLWSFIADGSKQNAYTSMRELPAQTELSKRISKALKAKGFRFVGPTTMYAFMQATGMVNDHVVGCPRHAVCAKLQRAFKVPKAGA